MHPRAVARRRLGFATWIGVVIVAPSKPGVTHCVAYSAVESPPGSDDWKEGSGVCLACRAAVKWRLSSAPLRGSALDCVPKGGKYIVRYSQILQKLYFWKP